jgi:N-methylhydantoinase B
MTQIDPLGAEIHRRALDQVTREMGITLINTSGSPSVYEGKDFATCLFDAGGEHVAFSGYVTFHLSSSLFGMRALQALLNDSAEPQPGDGYLLSDPRSAGAMHQSDMGLLMPIFSNNTLRGWTFTNMHVLDVGGVGFSGKAPAARDVYQEGIRFPPTRIVSRGELDSEWERFIAANVRSPDSVVNDIRSMIAANNTGARRYSQIITEYGYERHQQFCQFNKASTERLIRARINEIPNGTYEAQDWCEFDGHGGPAMLLELRARLEVRDTELAFFFDAVDQIDGFVNCGPAVVHGQCMTALMVMLCYGDCPVNAGLLRPIQIDAGRPGTVINSVDPAPCSNGHSEAGMRICKLTKSVLSQALSESSHETLRSRVAAQSQDGTASVALFGPNREGKHSVIFYVDMGVGIGGGAQTVHDGQDAYGATCQLGCGLPDVETHEANDPVLWLWRQLVRNGGGPGQFRGGHGISQGFTLDPTELMNGTGFNAVAAVPPRGVGGGYPGAANAYFQIRDTNVEQLLASGCQPTSAAIRGTRVEFSAKTDHLTLRRNDVQVWIGGGGAGSGDPLARDATCVLEDVKSRHITVGHARVVYGVAISGDSVDEVQTETLRVKLRSERLGAVPERVMKAAPYAGISISNNDGHRHCAYCNSDLAGSADDWRERVVRKSRPLAELFGEWEMPVNENPHHADVIVTELFCPHCAGALSVEIGLRDPPAPLPGEAASEQHLLAVKT